MSCGSSTRARCGGGGWGWGVWVGGVFWGAQGGGWRSVGAVGRACELLQPPTRQPGHLLSDLPAPPRPAPPSLPYPTSGRVLRRLPRGRARPSGRPRHAVDRVAPPQLAPRHLPGVAATAGPGDGAPAGQSAGGCAARCGPLRGVQCGRWGRNVPDGWKLPRSDPVGPHARITAHVAVVLPPSPPSCPPLTPPPLPLTHPTSPMQLNGSRFTHDAVRRRGSVYVASTGDGRLLELALPNMTMVGGAGAGVRGGGGCGLVRHVCGVDGLQRRTHRPPSETCVGLVASAPIASLPPPDARLPCPPPRPPPPVFAECRRCASCRCSPPRSTSTR